MSTQADPEKSEFRLASPTTPSKEPRPPAEFPLYDEKIPFAYCCPRCAYVWSGKPK